MLTSALHRPAVIRVDACMNFLFMCYRYCYLCVFSSEMKRNTDRNLNTEQKYLRNHCRAVGSSESRLLIRTPNCLFWHPCWIYWIYLSQAKFDDSARGSSDSVFGARLMEARTLLSAAAPEAVDRYKEALRMDPTMMTVWRELAAYYGTCGKHHAAFAALEIASSLASSSSCGETRRDEKFSCGTAAPLRLQMATNLLRRGEAEQGLAFVGDAFRAGKGGPAGHVLRGLINLKLCKDKVAVQAFQKAKETAPVISRVLDDLLLSHTRGVDEEISN